jgi:hypothetical protein
MERKSKPVKEVGVYAMYFEGDIRAYIGATTDFERRREFHLLCFRRGGNWQSEELRTAYEKFGEDALRFEMLERPSPEALWEAEFKWLNNFPREHLYNKKFRAHIPRIQRKPYPEALR